MSEPGSATMSILIEADGSVGDCTFSSTGQMIEQGDMSLCDVFGKQRYEPFVDADGKPVARRFIFRTDLTVEDAPAGKAKPSGGLALSDGRLVLDVRSLSPFVQPPACLLRPLTIVTPPCRV